MSHDHTSLGRVASSSGRGATCRSWLRRSRTSWAASRSRYIVRGAHRSASRRTWSLYSAVNRRRTARSRTSGSGTVGGGTTRSGAVAPFTIAGLGASGTPSWPAGAGRRRAFGFLALAMTETPVSALYSNLGGGRCLTIIGTEGRAEQEAVKDRCSYSMSPFHVLGIQSTLSLIAFGLIARWHVVPRLAALAREDALVARIRTAPP